MLLIEFTIRLTAIEQAWGLHAKIFLESKPVKGEKIEIDGEELPVAQVIHHTFRTGTTLVLKPVDARTFAVIYSCLEAEIDPKFFTNQGKSEKEEFEKLREEIIRFHEM